jgi:undecaprenyl-phosphate 4-deoxy-4-formamido-L-arabinose transferase
MRMKDLEQGISVVIPAYNSELTLEELVDRLEAVLADTAKREVIIVDDGSRDRTWPTIEKIARKHHRVRGITLMRNYGQHNALLCGIRLARYDVIVTIDDDLQHPPEELPKLLAALEGSDVVYGRPQAEQHGAARNTASRLTKIALRAAMGAGIATEVSAFRVFRTQLREAFASYDGSYVSIDPMLAWGTQRFSAVPVRHEPRPRGRSNYNWPKLALHALNLITTFSSWPLQIASLVGFGFTLVGLATLAYVVGRYQLFALGIMGEYLARVHSKSLSRPPFTIRESIVTDRD